MSCCQNKGNCQRKQEQQDFLVCTCMGVMQSDIIDAICAGADSFEALSEQLGVGTGCSSCVSQVHQILKEYKKPQHASEVE